MTRGYACFKGLQAAEFHNSDARLLHPLKRQPDGSFARIPLDQALDEIAAGVQSTIGSHGADAIACFLGTAGYMNASASAMLPHFMRAIGSTSYFSSLTIDQSAKIVTQGRLGTWAAGRQPWDGADVWMLVGANPLVSLSSAAGLPPYNGQKRLRDSVARGLKLVVVDPRRTETAHFAEIHLQPYPGTDPTVMAGLLRIILDHGWEDRDFCAAHVDGLDRLRDALRPFDAEFVGTRTGVPPDRLHAAAAVFGGPGKRGCAGTGTGACMSAQSNFADHMVELLNVVCGRYLRAGERVPNPGVTDPFMPKRAEVIAPTRGWESGRRSRIRGVGTLPGLMSTELACGIMADEMLLPGPGQIRSLFVQGGNPVAAIPDQRKIVEAFRGLDLIVAVDPFLSATAKLAHYIIPPKLQYERADLPMLYGLSRRFPVPFMQYTPEIAAPPAGSEVVDDWYVYWALARRLGVPLDFCGTRLDGEVPPTTEDLIRIVLKDGKVPFDEIKAQPGGKIFDLQRRNSSSAGAAQPCRAVRRAALRHRRGSRASREPRPPIGGRLPQQREKLRLRHDLAPDARCDEQRAPGIAVHPGAAPPEPALYRARRHGRARHRGGRPGRDRIGSRPDQGARRGRFPACAGGSSRCRIAGAACPASERTARPVPAPIC